MLTSLKGFLNVSRNVNSPIETSDTKSYPNINAGGSILNNFQVKWSELHQLNETNAKKANDVAETIVDVYTRIQKDNHNISQIIQLLVEAPNLNDSIANCVKQITLLKENFENVEKSLINLEDLIETLDLEKKKKRQRAQFLAYERNKIVNLEQFRINIAARHAQKVMQYEQKQKKTSEERQQVFQEAFEQDLATYKSMGTIPKINTISSQPSALLEEIQLECDMEELSQFLE